MVELNLTKMSGVQLAELLCGKVRARILMMCGTDAIGLPVPGAANNDEGFIEAIMAEFQRRDNERCSA